MTDDFWSLPVEERAVQAMNHFMLNIRDLPEFACDESPLAVGTYWVTAQIGCLEAFFMNVRLCADFFWKMPQQDVTARTLLPSWESASGDSLEEWWLLASQHVAHMGRARFPEEPVEWPIDTSASGLHRVATECHDVLADFARAYEDTGGDLAVNIAAVVEGTTPLSLDELRALRRGKPCPFPPVHPLWPDGDGA